jgi:hypothetical protein
MTMSKYKSGNNNAALGAIMPKSGKHYAPLCRSAGFNMANESTCGSKTKSAYPHSSKHYHYEAASFFGDNENVRGYNPE